MESEFAVRRSIPATTVAEAVAGDTMAFARIVAAHHDDMARVCFVICGDLDMAQDAVQTAWPIAWQKLGSLRDPDRLRAWLVTIAANEVRRLVRSRRRQRVVQIQIADVGSDADDPDRRSETQDLAAALTRLSSEDRTLIALRHVAGLDATEIGVALGLSPSGVRSRLSRATARLRKELGDD